MVPTNDFTLAECARSVALNRSHPYALLLGAGASVTSGIASAGQCIWQWKQQIVISEQPELGDALRDPLRTEVQARIQGWLDRQGSYPQQGVAEEYCFYAERCFPSPRDRQEFFRQLTAGKTPHIGYQLLALLAAEGRFNRVWSTNFDSLVETAIDRVDGLTPISIGLDTPHRTLYSPRQGEVLCIHLHGDYRHDLLKNTNDELRQQDQTLRTDLAVRLRDQDLLVIGYSGRDLSLMTALDEAYAEPGPGRIYWCGYGSESPSPAVTALLARARQHRREAYFVGTGGGFDEVMRLLAQCCLTDERADRATWLLREFDRTPSPPPVLSLPMSRPNLLLRSNAYEVSWPAEVYQFEPEQARQAGAWKWLRETVAGKPIAAAVYRGTVVALGLRADIEAAFAVPPTEPVKATPVGPGQVNAFNESISRLFSEALIRSIARQRQLGTDGRFGVWERDSYTNRRLLGRAYQVHRAAELRLRRYQNTLYLLIHPTVVAFDTEGHEAPLEAVRDLRYQLLRGQHNQEYNQELSRWRRLLLQEGAVSNFCFPSDDGGHQFKVRFASSYATVDQPRGDPPLAERADHPVVTMRGTVCPEPLLVFCDCRSDGYARDAHPIQGLLHNRPYDYPLTTANLSSEVRVGIICPTQYDARVHRFLSGLHEPVDPNTKDPYLPRFPGFTSAFHLPLCLPRPGGPGWYECADPSATSDEEQALKSVGRALAKIAQADRATVASDVLVVVIPQHWDAWTHVRTDSGALDLRQHIKAFCAERGIATQFLREATLDKDALLCEVRWWLSLALYVKAMRTPWVLDASGEDTAYVGLGFSNLPSSDGRNHVVIGCSHVFNCEGSGLRYHLSRLDNPVTLGRNPHLSRDDAYRMGDDIRRLFYDSLYRLPERVVIHKRTRFTTDEKEGLLAGLADVNHVEMLEICEEPALRFTRLEPSRRTRTGFDAHRWPVPRGTVLAVSDQRFLLWVHGDTQPGSGGRHYFKGGLRIPGPLLVVRHHGRSDLPNLATEIMGLSKMDWNSFDLYSQMPITISSANAIAQIGPLLRRCDLMTYDYRLFM